MSERSKKLRPTKAWAIQITNGLYEGKIIGFGANLGIFATKKQALRELGRIAEGKVISVLITPF